MKSCFRPFVRGKLRQPLGGDARLGQFEDSSALHFAAGPGRPHRRSRGPCQSLRCRSFGRPAQGREALAGDARAAEVQRVQVLQAGQLGDAAIGDAGLAQVEHLQLAELRRCGRC